MSTIALMTFAEFENLPETPGKHELIDGEYTYMPPPELNHTALMKRVYALLLRQLDEIRVWPDHTGYRIASGWIEPDVSVIWPDQPRDDKYFLRSPMLAVEVLSPGEDIERKLTLYFDEGAQEVWILDSRRNTMTVYVMRDGNVIRLPVETSYRSDAVGLTVELSGLFQ